MIAHSSLVLSKNVSTLMRVVSQGLSYPAGPRAAADFKEAAEFVWADTKTRSRLIASYKRGVRANFHPLSSERSSQKVDVKVWACIVDL